MMNISNLSNYTNQSALTPAETKTLAEALLVQCKEVKFAYRPYWEWALAEMGSTLPVPKHGCNWKEPHYAQGLSIWEAVCNINGWK